MKLQSQQTAARPACPQCCPVPPAPAPLSSHQNWICGQLRLFLSPCPSLVLALNQGRYLAIARRGKEAVNERRSCPATHVHHKVVVANKELT